MNFCRYLRALLRVGQMEVGQLEGLQPRGSPSASEPDPCTAARPPPWPSTYL